MLSGAQEHRRDALLVNGLVGANISQLARHVLRCCVCLMFGYGPKVVDVVLAFGGSGSFSLSTNVPVP